ncbi:MULTISPECIES: hypothetical protein [Polaromonas]|uniref:Uncharacterized protein n=1 Tax=Polaromonas aquatica TaxID=332657 RepID=A0ABW1U0N8_9BURK
MNLNANPSITDLKDLIASANDSAGHHILWVDTQGDVYLNCLDGDLSPVGFEDKVSKVLKLRYETFERGSGYMGPEAALDEAWVGRLFRSLVKEWQDRPSGTDSEYIDEY